MFRFVDVRASQTGYRFSFWNTATNHYQTFSGAQAWNTFDDFLSYLRTAVKDAPVPFEKIEARYRGLCPEWAFKPVGEAESDWLHGGPDAPPLEVGMHVHDAREWAVEWITYPPDAVEEPTWALMRCGRETLRRPLDQLAWNQELERWEVRA